MLVPSLPALGVYPTEHEPETRVQLGELKVPAALEPKLTVPVGVIAVPRLVSLTVAVQVDPTLTWTDAGTHTTEVPVVLWVAVRAKVPELPEWSVSPPYVPVMVLRPSDPGLGV